MHAQAVDTGPLFKIRPGYVAIAHHAQAVDTRPLFIRPGYVAIAHHAQAVDTRPGYMAIAHACMQCGKFAL